MSFSKHENKTAGSNDTEQTILKNLKFINPGPALEDFKPEQSLRQERKLRRMMQQASKMKISHKKGLYDDGGHLVSDGRDLCDCLREKCPGCFYPCEKCRSSKCGVECRCLRKWHYESLDVEGGDGRNFPSTNRDGNEHS